MIIDFERFEKKLNLDPYYAEKWQAMTEEKRLSYYDYINTIIQNHEWRGQPLDNNIEAFPRVIDNQLIYFDSQEPPLSHLQFEGIYKVLPSYWLVEATVRLIAEEQFKDQKIMHTIGVKSTTVGPLEMELEHEFYEGRSFDPLPAPLWERMKKYSKYYEDRDSVPFCTTKIVRS